MGARQGHFSARSTTDLAHTPFSLKRRLSDRPAAGGPSSEARRRHRLITVHVVGGPLGLLTAIDLAALAERL
jgi:hypothetical protein